MTANPPVLTRIKEGHFRISGELSLDSVGPLRNACEAALGEEQGTITIDLADTAIRGTAVLALMIALKRNALARQQELIFTSSPENLRLVAEASGVAGLLGLKG